jgi:hypothetical protein
VEVHKIDEIYLMAALLSATAEKTCFRLGFKYEFFISRFEFGQKPKNKKKIFWPSSIAVLVQQHQKKIRLNTPSWSRPRYTESANNLVKDGVNTHNIFGVDVRASVTQD